MSNYIPIISSNYSSCDWRVIPFLALSPPLDTFWGSALSVGFRNGARFRTTRAAIGFVPWLSEPARRRNRWSFTQVHCPPSFDQRVRPSASTHPAYPLSARFAWTIYTVGVIGYTLSKGTLFPSEPPQFLGHYYHFVAALFFGIPAFWHGSFSTASESRSNSAILQHPTPPPLNRLMLARTDAVGWRNMPATLRYTGHCILEAHRGECVAVGSEHPTCNYFGVVYISRIDSQMREPYRALQTVRDAKAVVLLAQHWTIATALDEP
ncbi:hypothetical protein BDZ89DRAFT_1138160 [Hymenopellis radicata]|nr:hypothetical protein BDZ89DRAFT_1138160 [Hymenopellis radicata]